MSALQLFRLPTSRYRRPAPAASCVALLAAVWLLSWTRSAVAQSPCDPALPRNDGQESGYQQRADRCEGIYKRLVASFGVQLVSLTGSLPTGDLCVQGQPVYFVWPRLAAAPAAPIRLQVESFRRDLNYRMNTDRPPQPSSYEWPRAPRCNSDVRLMSAELGVLARTQSSIGPKPMDVLVPVGLSGQPTAPVRPPYRAILLPGQRVDEVYVTLWYLEASANPVRIVFERPVQRSPYMAGSRIAVELSADDIKKPGLYRLVLNVEFQSGQRESIDRYFIDG